MSTFPIWSPEANAYVEAPVLSADRGDLRLQAVVEKHYVSGSDRTYFFEHGGKNWMSRSEDGEPVAEKREKLRKVIGIDDVSPGRRAEVERDLAAAAGDHLIVDGRHYVRTLGPALVMSGGMGRNTGLNLVLPDASTTYGHWFRDGRIALSAYDFAKAQQDVRRIRPPTRPMNQFEVTLIDPEATHDHVAAIGARMAILSFVAVTGGLPRKGWKDIDPLLVARDYADGIVGRNGIRNFFFDDKAGGIYQDMPHDDAKVLDVVDAIVNGVSDEWSGIQRTWMTAMGIARDRLADHVARTKRLEMDDLVGIRI